MQIYEALSSQPKRWNNYISSIIELICQSSADIHYIKRYTNSNFNSRVPCLNGWFLIIEQYTTHFNTALLHSIVYTESSYKKIVFSRLL